MQLVYKHSDLSPVETDDTVLMDNDIWYVVGFLNVTSDTTGGYVKLCSVRGSRHRMVSAEEIDCEWIHDRWYLQYVLGVMGNRQRVPVVAQR